MESLLAMLSSLLKVTGHQDLKQLVSTILLETKVLFECDQCSLFAVDGFQDDFVGYQVRNGSMNVEETRFKNDEIISLAAKGQVLNIRDAWSDIRFARARDLDSGYRTNTLLVAPLTTSNGKVVAVLQCVNKSGNDYFSESDEKELTTITALVADSIHRVLP